MECNRDEAEKCLISAQEEIQAGNIKKARKLAMKAKALFPSIPIKKEFWQEIERLKKEAKETKENNDRSSQGFQQENKENFSQEHLDAVKTVMNSKTLYEMLGVTKNSMDIDIKKAFKMIALSLHPDKNQSPGAEEAFKLLGNAVTVLTNPETRKIYNIFLAIVNTNNFHGHDAHQYPLNWWCSVSVNNIRKLENCLKSGYSCGNQDCERRRKNDKSKRQKQAKEAKKKKAEEEARRSEEDKKRKEEEAKKQKSEEEVRKRKEEEAKKRKSEEEARKRNEEAAHKKRAEEAKKKEEEDTTKQRIKSLEDKVIKTTSQALSWMRRFEEESRKLIKEEARRKQLEVESNQRKIKLDSLKKKRIDELNEHADKQKQIKEFKGEVMKISAERDFWKKALEEEVKMRREDQIMLKHFEDGGKKRKAQVDALKKLLDEEKRKRCEEESLREIFEEEAKKNKFEKEAFKRLFEEETRNKLAEEQEWKKRFEEFEERKRCEQNYSDSADSASSVVQRPMDLIFKMASCESLDKIVGFAVFVILLWFSYN